MILRMTNDKFVINKIKAPKDTNRIPVFIIESS